MCDISLRMYAFSHAREIEGASASIATVLATAEAIYRWLVESCGPLPTKH